ncbi:MAG TPA: hypothetical protein VKT77_19380 [Chthonomonadaceae bacterium]|nr:hypothetical protein [Chthonomonadaceae bacterium]
MAEHAPLRFEVEEGGAPPQLQVPRSAAALASDVLDARVEDYLDHIVAPMVGLVPYETRQEIRRDSLAHTRQLIAAHEELGSDRAEATVAALRQFGSPTEVARRWLDELQLTPSDPLCAAPAARRIPRSFKPIACALGASILTWVIAGVALDNYLNGGVATGIFLAIGASLPAVVAFLTGRRHALDRPVVGTLLAQAVTLPLWPLPAMWLLQIFHHVTSDFTAAAIAGAVSFAALAPTGCLAARLGAWSRTRRRGRRRVIAG